MDCGHIPMDDERRDHDLRALFEREQIRVTEQPFVNDFARLVGTARRRRTVVTRAAQAMAIGAVIAVSPWLVTGSALLSAMLEQLFANTASALDSPYGYGAGLLCFVAAAFVSRRRLFG